tara:strand:- start:70944 stop:71813 length:870 start_codon:yes stop_codon:yes gene_type:complete
MLIFFMKLLSSIRKAVAGRKHPHQLAWAVAFGLLLGIIPHGNLLALAVLVVVLTLKVNHAMAGLTAIGISFAATKLDPYSHQVGDFVLSHPDTQTYAASAWQMPLMPWTDLNNTVVMGSFLIGVVALIPAFVVTYPFFRFLAPKDDLDGPATEQAAQQDAKRAKVADDAHRVVVVDQGHQQIIRPHRSVPTTTDETPDFREIESDTSVSDPATAARSGEQVLGEQVSGDQVSVETRIDVIRLKDVRSAQEDSNATGSPGDLASSDDQPMDEALNYLLRQLRDSQSRKTA